jgi:DNA repair exonuclease SbcCD ATPase subunit
MRILSCQAQNFGSYKELNLDLADIGLSLVYGRTGSGKSTLPDVVAWTLFGTTAKDGAADDVRSWQAGSEAYRGYGGRRSLRPGRHGSIQDSR